MKAPLAPTPRLRLPHRRQRAAARRRRRRRWQVQAVDAHVAGGARGDRRHDECRGDAGEDREPPHRSRLRALGRAVSQAAQSPSRAAKSRSSSCGEPTLMRTEAGSPNGPSGRTITPLRSSRAANAAPSPTSAQTKFATPSSGSKPRSRRPAARRSRPASRLLRAGGRPPHRPRGSRARRRAPTCVTSNAFLTLRQAAATSGGQSP